MFNEKGILEGKYSSIYLSKTKKIVEKSKTNSIVKVQYFQRHDNVVLCGINSIIQYLQKIFKNEKNIAIWTLKDGDHISANEPVLQIEGPLEKFCLLEGIFDGYLARQTSIATNSYRVSQAANGKQVIYMGDRADDYRLLEDDGYAASVGNIRTQTVPIQITRHPGNIIGTMPHSLIQFFNGDLVSALNAYTQTFPNEKLTALVDFNNDVINDSLKVARLFKEKLVAVRVDTSSNISDKYFDNKKIKEYGVSSNLIKALRKALDSENFNHVKIIVSSGFTIEKIMQFEKNNTPVDVYGVGEALLKIDYHFTCDSVLLNNMPLAKFGRCYKKNSRLQKVILCSSC